MPSGHHRSPITIRPIEPVDHDWVVRRHGAIYAAEFGWDSDFERLVAGIVDDFRAGFVAGREQAWIAESGRGRVGSIYCCRRDEQTAQLRLLLVEEAARGSGVGAALVQQCLTFATEAGYESIMLWTNSVLTAARRLYVDAGFRLVDEEPHHSFGHDLVGQIWTRPLR